MPFSIKTPALLVTLGQSSSEDGATMLAVRRAPYLCHVAVPMDCYVSPISRCARAITRSPLLLEELGCPMSGFGVTFVTSINGSDDVPQIGRFTGEVTPKRAVDNLVVDLFKINRPFTNNS